MARTPRTRTLPTWARSGLTFDQFGLSLAMVVLVAASCLAPWQADTYWQLRAGEDLWRTGHVPLTDTYTHTIPGAPWPNHSWLWQAATYALFWMGGHPLATLGTAVASTAALTIALTTVRASDRHRLVALLVAIPVVAPTISIRPQATSLLLFAILVRLIARERFFWIPLVFLIWANTHAAVASGGLVLVAVTGLALVVWLRTRSTKALHRVRVLFLTAGVSAAATLINPLGIGLWAYVVTSVSKSRVNGIQEWESAFHLELRAAVAWALIALLVWLAIARRHALRGWPTLALLVIALAMVPATMGAIRNASFLAIAAVPALLALTSGSATQQRRDQGVLWHLPAIVAIAGAAGVAVAMAWSAQPARLGWDPVDPDISRAVADCPGPLYNTYADGGFLVWDPRVPVFIDSRQDPFPQELIEEAKKVEATGEYRSAFATYDIGCAMVPADSPAAQALVGDGWVIVASAGGSLVLFRESAPAS